MQDKKFDSSVAKIETRITDLGLNGKIIRLGIMKSVASAIEDEIKKGAKTIIAVGSAKILNDSVNAIARFYAQNPSYSQVPLGFIPVGKQSEQLGSFLGYETNERACDTISARRIKEFDLGKINNNYFLFQASISTDSTTVEIDSNYSIEITERGEVMVTNLPLEDTLPKEVNSSPYDQKLELFIRTSGKRKFLPLTSYGNKSVFNFQKLVITNPEKKLLVDSANEIATPSEVTLAKEKIHLIIGKNRGF